MKDSIGIEKAHETETFSHQFRPHSWRPPEAGLRSDGYPGSTWRTCSYCGSIHPKDLIEALKNGATLQGSDWKYGWPHKFYLNVPSPFVGQTVKIGTRSSGGKTEDIMGQASAHLFGKWYNDHFRDLDGEDFKELADAILKHTDIEFILDSTGIAYRAPYKGYQK